TENIMLRKLPVLAGLPSSNPYTDTDTVRSISSTKRVHAPIPATDVSHLQNVQYGPGWPRDYDYRRENYWHRCRYWRHRCNERWGWCGWGFPWVRADAHRCAISNSMSTRRSR